MIKSINTGNLPVLKTKAIPCIPLEDSPLSGTLIHADDSRNWPDEVINLVQDLLDTAYSMAQDCLGLAANQIWDQDSPPPAIFVARILNPDNPSQFKFGEFINPIVRTSGHKIKLNEGCLSKPSSIVKTTREINATITYQTLTYVDPITMKFYGKDTMLPIILQHEYDHLQGKII